jgi:peptide/nickel transport system permease protein
VAEANPVAGAPISAPATGGLPEVAVAPWRVALRALGRSWTGRISIAVVLLIVLSSLAAPLYAKHVAHTGPFTNHVVEVVKVNGKDEFVVTPDGIPIGPTYQGRFFLGAADSNGRDEMVRLLYGGRNSLQIALIATLLTLIVGTLLALLAGYYRGWVDAVISRGLDILWSTPVILLGIALGVATALGGISLGFITISGDSLFMPALIIGVVNIVYVARPLRGVVLSLRERPFVEAARSQGAGSGRIILREILPNLGTSLLVLGPIMISQTVALEAALSFLGAGVQPPNPSWGTLLSDGLNVLITSPYLTVIPGAILASLVLSLNLIGDIIREALDPRGVLTGGGKGSSE